MAKLEDKLVELLTTKQQIEEQFKQANEVIATCKQQHAEVIGGIQVLEALISEKDETEEESEQHKKRSYLISMQKVINTLSVLSFVLSAGLAGGTAYAYFWITSEETQEKLTEYAVDAVKGALPIPGALTGPALPTASPSMPSL